MVVVSRPSFLVCVVIWFFGLGLFFGLCWVGLRCILVAKYVGWVG